LGLYRTLGVSSSRVSGGGAVGSWLTGPVGLSGHFGVRVALGRAPPVNVACWCRMGPTSGAVLLIRKQVVGG
jgi:hypothetical protein